MVWDTFGQDFQNAVVEMADTIKFAGGSALGLRTALDDTIESDENLAVALDRGRAAAQAFRSPVIPQTIEEVAPVVPQTLEEVGVELAPVVTDSLTGMLHDLPEMAGRMGTFSLTTEEGLNEAVSIYVTFRGKRAF